MISDALLLCSSHLVLGVVCVAGFSGFGSWRNGGITTIFNYNIDYKVKVLWKSLKPRRVSIHKVKVKSLKCKTVIFDARNLQKFSNQHFRLHELERNQVKDGNILGFVWTEVANNSG